MKRSSERRRISLARLWKLRSILLLLWLVLWLLSSLSGCTQADVSEEDPTVPPSASQKVDAVFHLAVLAGQVSPTRSLYMRAEGTIETDSVWCAGSDTTQTKAETALPEAEENRIAHLWVGQYAADGNRVMHQYFPVISGTEVDVKLRDSGEATHHVWFVVNASDLGEIATEEGLKKLVLSYASTDQGLPSNTLCPMTGMWSGVISEGGMENIPVDLTRLVAKISFGYLIGSNGFTFTPSSVSLNSVPDRCRVEAPGSQLEGVTYKTYTGVASGNGATMHWYLPENMAGTVTGELAAASDKQKTGRWVSNATYIELSGEAVQSGVKYENVKFRFYPGSDKNNYDIVRNCYYTMNVTLAGIDISDERITVGRIPQIDIGGLQAMPASLGGTTELQITARPGQEWTLKLPDWLSLLIDGTTHADATSDVTYQGPAGLKFTAETANPKAESRSFVFPLNVSGEEQSIEIVQNGSTLETGNSISLGAVSGFEGSTTFTATKGLPWRAVFSDLGWLDWAQANTSTSGAAATGEQQSLSIVAKSSNPYGRTRTNSILLEGGESMGTPGYTGLRKEITVTQSPSQVNCPSEAVTVTAEGADHMTSSFTATPGLSWRTSVTSPDDWITLTGQTSGSTTTESQTVTFKVPVNPDASVRNGTITVRAGDESEGPTGAITVKQAASSLAVEDNTLELEPTADVTASLVFTGTKGLSYNLTCPDWLEFTGDATGTTTGSRQNVGYKTKSVNQNNVTRDGRIVVVAGNITKETPITQKASTFTVEPTTLTFPHGGGTQTLTVTGTSGLAWTVTRSSGSEAISASPADGTTGEGQTVTVEAAANDGGNRSATFTLAVINSNHSQVVTVEQEAALGITEFVINEAALKRYYDRFQTNPNKGYSWTTHPPFDVDGTDKSSSFGITKLELNNNPTMTGSYTIQVQKKQKAYNYTPGSYGTVNYSVQKQYCANLGEDNHHDWRVPTELELYEVCLNRERIGGGEIDSIPKQWFWSSSYYNHDSGHRCRVRSSDGVLDHNYTDKEGAIRCVRIKRE